ncbi:nitroreductase family protein [Nocardioides marmoriginsengisoli]|uniref:Nitroreductase family protein n=1 Tax=Nocardioides marmoriginsengisoli TaxID=661483 RepID=A0A3N0CB00_9ACTN|nr:nitroreductase family protein [Nocardioides marmoriginsengisoli]RNL60479.1 nitroreductase family protein [Nocardioides marmoriginsengisoli]
MQLQEVIDRRRMVRNYADRPVDRAIVDRALRNATHAPSAGFTQGWGFLVLDTPADVRRWWATTTDAEALASPDPWLTGMMRAPVVIVPCSSRSAYLSRYAEKDKALGRLDRASTEDPWPVPYWHLDTAMAALLILQTCVDEGLGACFFGIPGDRMTAVRDAFSIAADFDPIGVITLGHRVEDTGSAGSPSRRVRKPMDDVVHRGSWASS